MNHEPIFGPTSTSRPARLGDVAYFLDHKRVPVSESERAKRISGKNPNELYPYYGANGQAGWIDDYLFDHPAILLAEDGGAFGSRISPIAYAVSGRYWVNNHAHILVPKPGVSLRYLLHAISIRPDLASMVAGATRAKLNQATATNIPVLMCPLDDQRRIADQLDEQMKAVAAARQALEAQLAMINALPLALLREAFGGM